VPARRPAFATSSRSFLSAWSCRNIALRRESLQDGVRVALTKHRCNWLAPAKRRVADIGGVIPRPEESLPRATVPAFPLPWVAGRLCPRLNAYATADSRRNSCAAFDATDNVVQALASDGVHESFRKGILPGDRGAVSTSSIPISRVMA
jgi:hypothetical protein